MSTPKTIYDKIWESHIVDTNDDGTTILYIDRHLVHEVTSPQAFEGLRLSGRKVRRPEFTLATADPKDYSTQRDNSFLPYLDANHYPPSNHYGFILHIV